MSKDARFWRNVILIALAHVALVIAFVRWNRDAQKPTAQNVVWMDGGAGEPEERAAAVEPSSQRLPDPTPEPTPQPTRAEEANEESPALTAANSDMVLPTPTPRPTPLATPTPGATAKPTLAPTARPKPSATPKPTPKPSPKPTPKPTPKPKKPAPKASPKASATPTNDDDDRATIEENNKEKEAAKAALAKKEKADEETGKKATATSEGAGKGGTSGSGGKGTGAGGAAEFGWYGNMLHDRFYGEWVQPTSVVATGAKISALVRIRIERDGRISKFEIVKPSGNVVVDESVQAVTKRVTQVDGLPKGLGGEHYEVNINFELNPEQ